MKRGTRVGQAYVAITVDGDGINEEIVDEVEKSEPGVEDSGDRAGRKWREKFADSAFGKRMDAIRDGAAVKLRERMGIAGEESGKDFSHNFGNGIDDHTLERIGDRLGANIAGHMLDGFNHAFGDADTNHLGALFDKLMSDVVSGNGRSGGSAAEKSLGDRVGRLFGAGARNNAFNILGRSIGGVINIIQSGTAAGSRFFTTLSNGFASASEGGLSFSRVWSGVSSAFATLLASGPAIAVALTGIALAMSLVVSVANALLAIVVALSATIVSALVGALAVGTAALGALGIAAGLTVLAFMSMTNAQKDMLSAAMKPLHEEAIGLGQTMLTALVPAFAEWSRHLQVALAYAQPLASVMGGALAQAGNILTASLSGPGVQMLLTMLTVTLPGIVTHLSSALGGFINGMSGLFAALLPYVLQFSIYLERVATRFANWATSAKGQNAIVDFVQRALSSLASLWNFVTAIGGLLATVFFGKASQRAGENIFDRMARAVRKFTDYISREDRLEKWLAEGVAFATALGDTFVTIGKVLQEFNQSGVLDVLATIASLGAKAYGWWAGLPAVLQNLLNPLLGISRLIGYIGSILGMDTSSGAGTNPFSAALDGILNTLSGALTVPIGVTMPDIQGIIDSLTASGANALANTYESAGGYMPDPTKPGKPKKPDYVNPYIEYANQFIASVPTFKQMLRKAMKEMNKSVTDTIQQAQEALGADAVKSLLGPQIDAIKAQGTQAVEQAQAAVSNAAQTLANATSKKDAKKALKELHQMQQQLALAQAAQEKLNAAAKILADQRVVSAGNVAALVAGLGVTNATLADYAEARSQVADMLTEANKKLADAIAVRDNYRTAVTDAINTFAALTTAQAKTLGGVQQALTANDITTNLQSKLDQIKKFQANLNILLSQGLSQSAYKQLVDAGVEQGGQFAQALVNGGQGAVRQVNSLTSQIDTVAQGLGSQVSDRLYQAGVNAAQGLVDGLTSLSAQLDSAATALGESIALAVKRALGIASPSKVLWGLMEDAGDGVVGGLNAQHGKVGSAAARLMEQVAVSPEVAAYAAAQGGSQTNPYVSGNDRRFRDIVIQTPTKDPLAVAHEAVNEIVGRL